MRSPRSRNRGVRGFRWTRDSGSPVPSGARYRSRSRFRSRLSQGGCFSCHDAQEKIRRTSVCTRLPRNFAARRRLLVLSDWGSGAGSIRVARTVCLEQTTTLWQLPRDAQSAAVRSSLGWRRSRGGHVKRRKRCRRPRFSFGLRSRARPRAVSSIKRSINMTRHPTSSDASTSPSDRSPS